MKKILAALLITLSFGFPAYAQEEVQMADTMRSNGKIFVVLAIVLIILAGLFWYLFLVDRKISRLERKYGEKAN